MSLLDEYRGRAIADAETIAELRAECERLRVQFNNAEWEGTRLRADVAEAVALIRSREWFDDQNRIDPYCPWCEQTRPIHMAACPAWAFLAKHEAGR